MSGPIVVSLGLLIPAPLDVLHGGSRRNTRRELGLKCDLPVLKFRYVNGQPGLGDLDKVIMKIDGTPQH